MNVSMLSYVCVLDCKTTFVRLMSHNVRSDCVIKEQRKADEYEGRNKSSACVIWFVLLLSVEITVRKTCFEIYIFSFMLLSVAFACDGPLMESPRRGIGMILCFWFGFFGCWWERESHSQNLVIN